MTTQKELLLYETAEGRCPFTKWLQGLSDRKARAIIKTRLDRLEAYGHRGTCEPVGGGVFELKIFYGPGYRIYFMEESRQVIVLLCGGDKRPNKGISGKPMNLRWIVKTGQGEDPNETLSRFSD